MPPKVSQRWVPVNRNGGASHGEGDPADKMPSKVTQRWVPVNRPAGVSRGADKSVDAMHPKVTERCVPINRPAGVSRGADKSVGEMHPNVTERCVPINRPAGVVSRRAGNTVDEMHPKVSKPWAPVNRPAVTPRRAGNTVDGMHPKLSNPWVPVNLPAVTPRVAGMPVDGLQPKVTKRWVPVNRPAEGTSSSQVASVSAALPDADRLSVLPDALLHHIMSFLKAWEMVRTCVLSRRWRDLSASAPCIDVRVGRYDEPPMELSKFVNRLLLKRDAQTTVDTLRVHSVGEDDFYETYNNDHVKRWIGNAIKRKARVIQLNGHANKYISLKGMAFVSCHLNVLKLSYTNLGDKVIRQLCCECPSLEELELKSCLVSGHEIASVSLKCLSFVKCKFTMNLEVDAPNLMFWRCIAPQKWVPVLKNTVSMVTGTITLDDSLLSREFEKYHDEDEYVQTSDEEDDKNNKRDGKNVAADESDDEFCGGYFNSWFGGFLEKFHDDDPGDYYDGYSDDLKDDYDYGSDINSDDGTYQYSEIATDYETKLSGSCYDGLGFNKSGKNHDYSAWLNDYKTLGGQNVLHSLSNATSLELSGHSGEVVLRRESISCPTFSNLKTLSLGEWCISRGADFDILVRLLQHSPNLEKLFLQLEMNFDIQKALERGIKPNGGSFSCKRLTLVKIRCTKDDPRVHMLARLFWTNGVPIEMIYIRRSGSFHLRSLKENRAITIAELREFR